jgi:hypothetical protein
LGRCQCTVNRFSDGSLEEGGCIPRNSWPNRPEWPELPIVLVVLPAVDTERGMRRTH